MNNIIKAKKRIINFEIDKKGRPVFVIASMNGYVLTANCTRQPQFDKEDKMILDINLEEEKITYLQRGFKILKDKHISDSFDPAFIHKDILEKWFGRWGVNKIITALVELVKLDNFYKNGFETEKIVEIALSNSKLSQNFKNFIRSSLPFYFEDTKSLKALKEFI